MTSCIQQLGVKFCEVEEFQFVIKFIASHTLTSVWDGNCNCPGCQVTKVSQSYAQASDLSGAQQLGMSDDTSAM
jgi:hypothetical protein